MSWRLTVIGWVCGSILLMIGMTGSAVLGRGGCDPAYPDVCIPSPPPDLDCADISARNFRVLAPDPHRFDRDNDGIGCEKNR